jgi:type IV pilus assembly protein PilW
MSRILNDNKGLTLIELMVAMAIFAIMGILVFQIHDSQSRMYVVQRQTAGLQQNIRAAMYFIGRDIRAAGYDRDGSAGAGFVEPFPDFSGSGGADYSFIGPAMQANYLAFSVDADANGTIDGNDDELIGYRLNGDRLEKFSTGAVQWQPIIENVDALNFVYLDADGNVTANAADVRSIEVTLTADSGPTAREVPRQMTLTSEFKARNLGLH